MKLLTSPHSSAVSYSATSKVKHTTAAAIASSSTIGEGASIAAFAVVREGMRIGLNAVIHPHVVIYNEPGWAAILWGIRNAGPRFRRRERLLGAVKRQVKPPGGPVSFRKSIVICFLFRRTFHTAQHGFSLSVSRRASARSPSITRAPAATLAGQPRLNRIESLTKDLDLG